MDLRRAVAADIPAMLAIFARAFAADANTQLKIAWRGEDVMQGGMHAALDSWLASSVATLLVVEAPASQIVGWACWSTFGPEHLQDDPAVDLPGADSPVEALERITGTDIRRCQNDVLLRYGRVEVLVAIAVDPAWQGRGVAGRLIGWGTHRADEAGRVSWVHASEAGSRAFAGHGFTPQSDLEVDLAPFAPPGDGRIWGTVRFCSMTRPPEAYSGE